jgi:hypothetical protein
MAPPALALLAAGLAGASGSENIWGFVQRSGERGGEHDWPLEEGAPDYAEDLRRRVLSNKQSVLPLPWQIIEERDVGYVGDLPLLPKAATEPVEADLLIDHPPLSIVSFKLKDTGQPATPPASVRMGAKGGKEILHLNGVIDPPAELTVLQWQKIRWTGLKEWLETEVARRPDRIAVVHSYGDVLYGGCALNATLHKYRQIIAASGGTQTIVMAAEVTPWPWALGWRFGKTNWTALRRTAVLEDSSLADGWATAFANCTDPAAGPCSSPPRYEFANAGLIMGPVGDIYDMFKTLGSFGGLDNQLANEYFLNHPEKVTLDYAGVLFFSLHNMVKHGVSPLEVIQENSTKVLYSNTMNTKVCFVHGNGNGFSALKDLAVQQDASDISSIDDSGRSFFSKWFN